MPRFQAAVNERAVHARLLRRQADVSAAFVEQIIDELVLEPPDVSGRNMRHLFTSAF